MSDKDEYIRTIEDLLIAIIDDEGWDVDSYVYTDVEPSALVWRVRCAVEKIQQSRVNDGGVE
jgi:hypothetical protein